MKVLIVGLGLIGGSFAKAIKAKTDDAVVGLDSSPETVDKALSCGAIDAAVTGIPHDADIVLIALYPHDTVAFLQQHLADIPDGCIVIDLCGVKRYVCHAAEELLAERDVVFIGGHPMAGREFFGFDASLPDLFEGASIILTPSKDVSRNYRLLAELFFKRLGFSTITYSTPERHDELIALTSQLAHIVSSAYVQNPAAGHHMGFSAGSFHDMTRVAKLHEEMWTELFLLNPDFLSEQIGQFIAIMEEFRTAITSGDREHLKSMLQTGRIIKERLNALE